MPDKPYEPEAIANLQRYLLQLSFFDPVIPPVPIDGVFNTATRDAIMAFQRQSGLPVTGTADRRTWELLYRAYLKSLTDRGRPEPIYIFPRHPDKYSVGLGDEGALITAIQYLLRDLIIDYGWDPEDVPISGIFDASTENTVRRFQALHGIPPTGRVDKVTWNLMALSQRIDANRYPEQ